MRSLFVFSAAFVILAAGPLQAQNTKLIKGLKSQKNLNPPAKKKPVKVKIGASLIHLSRISPPSQNFPTFEAEMYLDLKWKDRRLKFNRKQAKADFLVFSDRKAKKLLEKIWWPDIEVLNEDDKRETENLDVKIWFDGRVQYEERFHVTAQADFNLIRFPFDSQDLAVKFGSFEWDENTVQLVPFKNRISRSEKISDEEWEFGAHSYSTGTEKKFRHEAEFDTFIYSIRAERKPWYYIWKLVLPVILILSFAWSNFFLHSEPVGGRMQRVVISVLTVVAFHRILSGTLPRISYLTFLDVVIKCSYLFLFMAAVAVVYSSKKEDDIIDMVNYNRRMRWVLPLLGLATFLILGGSVFLFEAL